MLRLLQQLHAADPRRMELLLQLLHAAAGRDSSRIAKSKQPRRFFRRAAHTSAASVLLKLCEKHANSLHIIPLGLAL